jgi:hypothetical protein
LATTPHPPPITHYACGRGTGVNPKPPAAVASRGLTPAPRPKRGSGFQAQMGHGHVGAPVQERPCGVMAQGGVPDEPALCGGAEKRFWDPALRHDVEAGAKDGRRRHEIVGNVPP